MAENAGVACTSARTFLNDVGSQIWTDAILIPYVKEAHRDLLSILWLNGLPVLREKSAILPVNANVTSLTITDMVDPIWIKERARNSSEDWIPMTETDFEPDRNRDTMLKYWTWREEILNFIGATTDRDVLVRYIKQISVITNTGDSLGFLLAEYFVGPQTAGYAAGSVGNITLAKELLYVPNENIGVAGARLDTIIKANVKGQQNLPARRIPYRRFARSRLLL